MAAAAEFNVKDMQDPSSPYYIHPNENPSMVLGTPLLNEKNYYSWSNSVQMMLITKNKKAFIEGTIQEPPINSPLHPFWRRGWLYRSMSLDIAQFLIKVEKASAIWTELLERFSRSDLFRISEIQEQFFALKQGDLSVTKYYTSMKALWDELDFLDPVPVCTCGAACTCGALLNLETIATHRLL
jgi:hypothetical protein